MMKKMNKNQNNFAIGRIAHLYSPGGNITGRLAAANLRLHALAAEFDPKFSSPWDKRPHI